MAEFDEVAYSAACDLFNEAKRIRHALPSLIDMIDDSTNMLGAQRYDGSSVSGGGENSVEQAMVDIAVEHDDLMRKLDEKRTHYREVNCKCESVISDMEEHLEGDSLDSTMLRYYYMMDMDVPKIRKRLKKQGKPYADSWLYQKKEIALVRAAASVRRLHFL